MKRTLIIFKVFYKSLLIFQQLHLKPNEILKFIIQSNSIILYFN